MDRCAIEKLGISSLVLMENAGAALAREIVKSLPKKSRAMVVVMCGVGHNGADGFVAARHLLNKNCRVIVFLIGCVKNLKKDARVNCDILVKSGCRVLEITGIVPRLRRAVADCDVIVDAIFGVGLNRQIVEPHLSVITFLNNAKKEIIAADIASGLDATTGQIYGACIKAKQTVAFGFLKRGFYKNSGPAVSGRISSVDIGIPAKIAGKIG